MSEHDSAAKSQPKAVLPAPIIEISMLQRMPSKAKPRPEKGKSFARQSLPKIGGKRVEPEGLEWSSSADFLDNNIDEHRSLAEHDWDLTGSSINLSAITKSDSPLSP